uniref:NADH-ubiquinone oxidoreductase chain 1 n=1 Tax=Paraleonnates uschakovi TaxID=1922336 RepID=A0A343A8R9_9ANNE|nr:NADH dehydrogenase subunit 1 [Paraleonnates uschakovi]APG32419.1 NADH dehydrogenase subunit 1 [Paraleonnates uschakovi]
MSIFTSSITSFISALIAMAFFTLLERKILGYIQLRKGPNKVGIMGLPQPFADALKLITKELSKPSIANLAPFIAAPMMSLLLALILWILFPHSASSTPMKWSILLFLCVSSMNVYTTLFSGWSSNSKYALLGALRSIAQTISYEVSMALILISPLIFTSSISFNSFSLSYSVPMFLILWPLTLVWFTSTLAETNRTPFDLAEGESELVSGFNTEYSSGTFALIFMAEYMNIIMMSLLSACLFFSFPVSPLLFDLILVMITVFISVLFIWTRGAYPRMRYDKLMSLTWKIFLPMSLVSIIAVISMSI